MGWDAYSEPFTGRFGLDDPDAGDRAWDEVIADLKSRGISPIDGLLRNGGLDCLVCGEMLQIATGRSVFADDWSPETVKELASIADWTFGTFPSFRGEVWAYESAKAFLNHCAKLGKGIKFSW